MRAFTPAELREIHAAAGHRLDWLAIREQIVRRRGETDVSLRERILTGQTGGGMNRHDYAHYAIAAILAVAMIAGAYWMIHWEIPVHAGLTWQ
jgi:hypothetical protein